MIMKLTFKQSFSFVALVFSTILLSNLVRAQDLETTAKQVFLYDMETSTILFEKDADTRMYPASMTKMMTAYMLLEQVKNGALSLEDTFPVSRKAWKKGGSKMFVEVGKRVKIEDLLRGIIIQSGNDATIVVAEGLAGSEEAFARSMTDKAHELGMTNTQFKNASGWPDPEHYTTARDLAILAEATIRNMQEYYHIYSEEYFTFSGIKQRNRNPLIRNGFNGADGLKTGHTEASGYGLTASAIRDGRRLILVANGMLSSNERSVEAERIMTWGFREWKHYELFSANETVTKLPVWLGVKGEVPIIIEEEVGITLRRKNRDDLRVNLRYTEPVKAPIVEGTQLGSIYITAPDIEPVELPLIAAETVEQLGAFGRLSSAFSYLLWGEN